MNEEIKRLLELAAKAAGYKVVGDRHAGDGLNVLVGGRVWVWRPHADDGDALRLAVEARVNIEFSDCEDDAPVVIAGDFFNQVRECLAPDFKAKTRLAIVRAAAAIGEAMP